YSYLSKRKGIPYQQAEEMNRQVSASAAQLGLTYNLDKAVVANSFDAHRLIQYAKQHQLGGEAEERLFRAYFTEGKDMSDHATLAELAKEIGLEEEPVRQMLADNQFATEVRKDIDEAEALGIRGVPFFVFDRKYGVSGAQPSEAFLQALTKSVEEWQGDALNGQVCTPDGECN
ncbi:MAG TPA: DsbA family oxidoreductase, partial [Chitinophaga sp.]|nr:DsbA family oxidoreductase [Chitinophaga sp.]